MRGAADTECESVRVYLTLKVDLEGNTVIQTYSFLLQIMTLSIKNVPTISSSVFIKGEEKKKTLAGK